MDKIKPIAISAIVAGGCIIYGSQPAEAHVWACMCTDIVDFCYWANNH